MTGRGHGFWGGAVLAALVLLAFAPAKAAEQFQRDTIDLVTQKGRFAINVEMAVTWGQRAQGLQHRKGLQADTGMLFIYPGVQNVSMWMKNTYISLDMLFIGPDGRIVTIAANTEPLSLAHIPSEWPIKAVLELPAGSVARYGVLGGDVVKHPVFGNAVAPNDGADVKTN